MNFQQLRIIRETVRRGFNLTEVASALATSQSGVSKHIRDLEEELGVELFGVADELVELAEPVVDVLRERVETVLDCGDQPRAVKRRLSGDRRAFGRKIDHRV